MDRPHRTRAHANAAVLTIAAAALAACAHTPPLEQMVEVQVDPAAGALTLSCRASNALGSWGFSAPGSVSVRPSPEPLTITCDAPAGSTVEPSVTPAGRAPAAHESTRDATRQGAKVGAGAGVVLGVAAAPVMGVPFALLLAAGGALKGGQIGGAVGALRAGETLRYPSPVVLHLAPSTPPTSAP